MTQQTPAEDSVPGTPSPGIFLPSMIWTTDPEVVEAEKQRLLGIQQQLNAVMNTAHHADECATWHMMAQASLYQMDNDIEALFVWLENRERAKGRESPDRDDG